MSIFPKFFFTLFGNALPSWLRSYIARVDGDGGIIVDTGHTKEVYADVIDYNPLLIQTCDGGSADDLYSLFAFDDIDDLQLRVVADSGTNADVGQNAKVAQHLWRNDLHASASIVVTCASIKAGKLYGYQPTVEPNTTLLDYYTGAAAAYSLRSLSTSTTNVVKVRRSGDDAESDFTASQVSDEALAAWVRAGGGTEDGFVTTWYDQSGNTNNATQATAASQPKIVSSGTLVTMNGKAAIESDGTDGKHLTTSDTALSGDLAIITVCRFDTLGLDSMIVGGTSPTTRSYIWRANTNHITIRNNTENGFTSFTVSFSSQDLLFLRRTGTTIGLSVNGSETTNTEQSTQGLDFTANRIGGGFSDGYSLDGAYQEIILYNADQSANRTGIEANINDYYNIYP